MEFNQYYFTDVIDGLKSLEDNSIDIVIADPPYNIKKDFDICKDDLEIEDYLCWCDLWISECIRITKPTSSLFIYGFSEILAHLSVRINLKKRWLIWAYQNKNVPSYKTGWQRSHESILYLWKENPIFNVDDVRIQYGEAYLKSAVGKKRPSSKTSRYGDKETIYNANENGALPRDVFTDIPSLAGGAGKERYFLYNDDVYCAKDIERFDIEKVLKHPTQKPFRLTERLILATKPKENCKVVIPFGGSGSEGVVCKNLGVDFIGFDINEKYVLMANKAVDKYEMLMNSCQEETVQEEGEVASLFNCYE